MKHLRILRGLPGSGKSTLAAQMKENEGAHIFSIDDLFGDCAFSAVNVLAANDFNQQRVIKAMRSGLTPIVVDAPNVYYHHVAPYVIMSRHYGYEYSIIDMDTPWALDAFELFKKTTKNITKKTIQEMRTAFVENPRGEIIEKLEKSDLALDPEKLVREIQKGLEDAVKAAPQQCHPYYNHADSCINSYADWKRVGGFSPGGAEEVIVACKDQIRSWRDKT